MAAPDFGPFPNPPTLRDPLHTPVDGATVKSDAADLPFKPRAIHVSVAGNVKYTANGVTIGPEAWEVGWHPVRIDRLWSTGLSATLTLWR